MSRRIIILALLAVLVLGLAVGASATATITGCVKSPSNQPMVGAFVAYKSTPGAITDSPNVQTDGSGNYTINVDETASTTWYVAVADINGFYKPIEVPVTGLTAGATRTQDLTFTSLEGSEYNAGYRNAWGPNGDAQNYGSNNDIGRAFDMNFGGDAFTNTGNAGVPINVQWGIAAGSAQSVSGITIWWGFGRPTSWTLSASSDSGDPNAAVFTPIASGSEPTMMKEWGTWVTYIPFTTPHNYYYFKLTMNGINYFGHGDTWDCADIKELVVHDANNLITLPNPVVKGHIIGWDGQHAKGFFAWSTSDNPLDDANTNYVRTDDDGYFEASMPEGHYHFGMADVAGQCTPTQGWDYQLVAGQVMNQDFGLPRAGQNLVTANSAYSASSSWPNNPVDYAFDKVFPGGNGWNPLADPDNGWYTDPNQEINVKFDTTTTNPQYMSGVTIWWSWGRPKDYIVQVSADNGASYQTVHTYGPSTTDAGFADGWNNGEYESFIKLPSVMPVTDVKVKMNALGAYGYGITEIYPYSPMPVQDNVVTGHVTDPSGNPVWGAYIVYSTDADHVGDSTTYTTTDSNGFYQITLPAGSTYALLAWKDYYQSIKATGISTSGTTDFHFTGLAGADLCLPDGDRVPTYKNEGPDGNIAPDPYGRNPLSQAFNGDVNDGDAWCSAGDDIGFPQAVTIDLDPQNGTALNTNGMTFYWGGDRPSEYKIELSQDGTNYNEVYHFAGPTGGYDKGAGFSIGNWYYASVIQWPTQLVRKVKVTCLQHNIYCWGGKEFIVHSADYPMVKLEGTVKDSDGNPIERAIVSVGDTAENRRFLTDASGYFSFFFIGLGDCKNVTNSLLTCDAWQYANKDIVLTSAILAAPIDCTLTSKTETSALLNSDFENGTNHWALHSSTRTNEVDDDYYWPSNDTNATFSAVNTIPDHTTGSGHSCLVTMTPGGEENYWAIDQTIPVTPGQVFNFNLWRNDSRDYGFNESYIFYRANGTISYFSGLNSGDNHHSTTITDDNNWFRLGADWMYYRITVPDDASTLKFMIGGVNEPGQAVMQSYVDDVQLEEVDAAVNEVTGQVVTATGQPVVGAYVGYKTAPHALMDGQKLLYTTTDTTGHYHITAPVGKLYIAAFKEGYKPSADVYCFSATPTAITANTITLATADLDLVAGRADSITVENDGGPLYVKDYLVDGNNLTEWRSTSDGTGTEHYVIATFDSASDLTDIVLYRSSFFYYGDQCQDYAIDVMTQGTPSDPESWSDPSSVVTTVYAKNLSTYGAQINREQCQGNDWQHVPGLGLCTMPLNAHHVLGLRVRCTPEHWASGYANFAGIEIHGTGLYKPYASPAAVKLLADESHVSLTGLQLTAWAGASNTGEFGVPANTAFVEMTDRQSGIRLDTTGVDMSACNVDMRGDPDNGIDPSESIVNINGTMKTSAAGERYIQCVKITPTQVATPLKPLGMNGRFASSSAANGLYVKIWGIATVVSGTNNRMYMFDDGSGKKIRVRLYKDLMILPTGLCAIRGVLTTDGVTPVLYQTDNFNVTAL